MNLLSGQADASDRRSWLSWLLLLYRRPGSFCDAWDNLAASQQWRLGIQLAFLTIPCFFLISVAFNQVVQFLIPRLHALFNESDAFRTLAERGFYGIAAVACLELLVWRRRDPVELEHSGTERLRTARLLTMRRIALLAAVLLSLVYTASTLRTADGSPEVQNLVFRTVITALAACTMPMALELYFWIHRRPTGTEEPMIGDRSRASARIAGRLLVYLPVVCILYLVVFSYVGLPIPSGVPEIQTRAQFAKIVEAALEGVVKGVTVGAVAGMLVGYLASPTHGIALGFIGAMAGGLALGTTSRNAPTLLLMIAPSSRYSGHC